MVYDYSTREESSSSSNKEAMKLRSSPLQEVILYKLRQDTKKRQDLHFSLNRVKLNKCSAFLSIYCTPTWGCRGQWERAMGECAYFSVFCLSERHYHPPSDPNQKPDSHSRLLPVCGSPSPINH